MVNEHLQLLSDNLVQVINHVDDAIYIKSLDGTYLYANARAAALIGKPVARIVGSKDADLFPPDNLKSIVEIDAQVLTKQASISTETKYTEKSKGRGKPKDLWIHTLISPTFSDAKELTGLVGISRDITEQKQLTQKLQTYSEEIDIILQNSSDAIYRKDLLGSYVFINNAGAKMLKLTPEEVIGKTDSELFGNQITKRIRQTDREVISTEMPQTLTTQYTDEKGDLWFNVSVSPAHDARRNTVGVVGVSKNITDIKMLEMALREKNEQLFTILESSEDAIFAKDLQGVYLFVNKACETYIGKASSDIIGRTDEEIFGEEVAEAICALDRKVMSTRRSETSEECFGPKNQEVWYQATISPAFSSQGNLVGVIGVSRNMTEYRRTQQELWNSEARYHSLYHDTPAIFLTLDVVGNVVEINAYGAQKLGYSIDELKNTSIYKIIPAEDKNAFRRHLQTVLDNPGTLYQAERRYISKEGNIIWGKDFARVVFDQDGNPSIPVLSEDLTAAKELTAEISFRDTHDALTGLVNRNTFEDALESAIQTARNQYLTHSLCILKLDNLKLVNDTLGSKAADALLTEIGLLVKDISRERDIVSRLEGAEFAVLMQNTTAPEAENRMEALLERIKDYHFSFNDKPFLVSANVGVFIVDQVVTHTVYAMTRAANALLSAKSLGKNRLFFYDESGMGVQTRHQELGTIADINYALVNDHFVLHAQQIAPLGNADLKPSYEILTRMLDREDKMVPPDLFIPVLEQNQLAHELDDWVILNTFKWLTYNREVLDKVGHFSINLSGQSISNDELLDKIRYYFIEYDIPHDKICFEVTETATISALTKALHFLTTLRDLGCLISLDDFGAGLSSFRYLQELPIDYVKIDGAFIKHIDTNMADYKLAEGMHNLVHQMGMKTVAEYVENDEILKRLNEMGVEFAQGYFIGRPAPIDEIKSALK